MDSKWFRMIITLESNDKLVHHWSAYRRNTAVKKSYKTGFFGGAEKRRIPQTVAVQGIRGCGGRI